MLGQIGILVEFSQLATLRKLSFWWRRILRKGLKLARRVRRFFIHHFTSSWEAFSSKVYNRFVKFKILQLRATFPFENPYWSSIFPLQPFQCFPSTPTLHSKPFLSLIWEKFFFLKSQV